MNRINGRTAGRMDISLFVLLGVDERVGNDRCLLNGSRALRSLYITLLVLLYLSCTSIYGDSEPPLTIEDFVLEFGDDRILVGESFDEALKIVSDDYSLLRKEEMEWNLIGYVFDGITLTYIEGYQETIFSIAITGSEIRTSRQIGVGSTRAEVKARYLDVLNSGDVYIYSSSEEIILQMTFFEENRSELESKKSYYGSKSKELSLTFHFDEEELVERIVLNISGYE